MQFSIARETGAIGKRIHSCSNQAAMPTATRSNRVEKEFFQSSGNWPWKNTMNWLVWIGDCKVSIVLEHF